MKKLAVILVLILLFYGFSYVIFRQMNQEIWEKDSQTYVIFPENKVLYYLFRPLVLIDGRLTSIQFHIGQHH